MNKDFLQIGWAKRSIIPDQPVPITGQFHLRVSQGVYTPVIASALVLANNSDAVIFVSVDVVSVRPLVLQFAQDFLKKEAPEIPADNLIINATHTHAGPGNRDVEDDDYPHGVKFMSGNKVAEFIARQIADAVKEAWQKRAPGSIAYGYGFATTGHSRRVVYLDDISKRIAARPGIAVDGHGKMYGKTDDSMFDCYEAGTDSFINLLYTFDEKGKLSGAIVNVPCPSQTNEGAWALHASFWDNVRRKLAEKYGEIGLVCQSAAAGDLSPRQLHYLEAELRRYRLKYADKIEEYFNNPMAYPPSWVPNPEIARKQYESDVVDVIRAEEIASRIVAAFDEVLEWAQKEKFSNPVLKHEVKAVKLARLMFPKELAEEESRNYQMFMQKEFQTEGEEFDMLFNNSRLVRQRTRCGGVEKRYKIQQEQPFIDAEIHVVRIGNIAFASNQFELFMDYMHRIQGRSPFEQTFIVQLTAGPEDIASYLATERAVANRGYSASPYCNLVSPEGGQQLVNETLEILEKIKK